MTTIAPSLLACNFFNIENELNLLKAESNIWIHLDIMDGHFVPNLTFGASIIKNMSNKTSHKLDAHLMVSNPEHYVEVFKNLGLHNFCFHWEATNHPDRLVQHAKTIYPSVGIALNPGTDIKV
ncbi:MAG: ribulose-phosphate 3-epimerase, partial [Thermoproteota archaeon]